MFGLRIIKAPKKVSATRLFSLSRHVDQIGNTIEVPELIPESDVEIERYAAALRRRQLSLILGGRMKPKDATELKSIFEDLSE